VHFRGSIDEPGARAWGRPLDLALSRRARDGTWFLFDAPLDLASLLPLTTSPPGPAIDLTPIMEDVSATRPGTPLPSSAAYHRIPADRNKLVVLLEPGLDAAYDKFLADHHAIVLSGAKTARQIVRFVDEGAMMAAQADIGAVRSVRRAGPLLSEKPLAFLTNQLVVRFSSPLAVQHAGVVLDQYRVHESRELSYIDNGFLYQVPLPSYGLYDLARELILEGHALFAVPNVATFSESACRENTCKSIDVDPVNIPHLEYLRMIKACDVRAASSASNVVLAILDEGIQADPSLMANDRLRVETAIDFKTMQSCHPGDPYNWWSTTTAPCGPVFNPPDRPVCPPNMKRLPAYPDWDDAHGNRVALLAAADCDDSDLMGIAPATPLINARLGDVGGGIAAWTDVAFADALWWLSGGDPAWWRDGTNYPCIDTACGPTAPPNCVEGELPTRLGALHRAGVINLSFVRHNFLDPVNCPGAATCQLVCTNTANCGVINGVLDRIRKPEVGDGVRDGGAVVVAAAGREGTGISQVCYSSPSTVVGSPGTPYTSLAESPSTIAVGSVQTTGEPFYSALGNDCLINHGGPFLHVVAPMGGTCTLCTNCGPGELKFGESSAATAVVSGVVTLMLEKKPQLTADQAKCILQKTADTYGDPGEMWEASKLALWTKIPPCPFDVKGHSNCLGFGMVDASAAVATAEECANPLSTACPCPAPPDTVLDVHRIDVDMSMAWQEAHATVPAIWGPLRECIDRGPCRCAVQGPVHTNCFVGASMRNLLRAYVPAASFKICGDGTCRPLEGPPLDWAPNGELVVRLEMTPEYLEWARKKAGPQELRLFSRGEAVTERMLAKFRKARASPVAANPMR
jgi:subtilisin family serine protease